MLGFDVLDRTLPIYRSHFLEASAGTGKTFAIEHLVVRLLLDENGPAINQILVVTFTKAATRELKARIRKAIERVIGELSTKKSSYDYLKALFEKGDEAVLRANYLLKQALARFDDLNIFTLHSFCFHSLQAHAFEAGLALDHTEESAGNSRLRALLKDFFRTEVHTDEISLKQLDLLLKYHNRDIDRLISHMIPYVSRQIPLQSGTNYQDTLAHIQSIVTTLKEKHGDLLYEDLLTWATHFQKMCDRQKTVKPEIAQGLLELSEFFAGKPIDLVGSPLLMMQEPFRLKRASTLLLPPFLYDLQTQLVPVIEKISSPLALLARFTESARQYTQKVITKEEWLLFDDLLYLMAKETHNDSLAQQVRSQYRAVFIDEFQDTDPLQWSIFSRLFLSDEYRGTLYLVGDPKQSIYRFRSADIYTYLEAKKALGHEAVASLDCNYRSDPTLLDGLNLLFSKAGPFIPLPKWDTFLPYTPVRADPRKISHTWKDKQASLLFMEAESESDLFENISQEINRLHQTENIPYHQCAILVKDRFQGSRILSYLQAHTIPAVTIKSRSLLDSPALKALEDLLKAVENPRHTATIIQVVLGPLFLLNADQIKAQQESLKAIFFTWHHLLVEEGIFALFEAVMTSQGTTLLQHSQGETLYLDLLHLCELLASQTDSYLPYLHTLSQEDPDSEHIKARQYHESDAVQILTMHVSKGLEFEIVFPIGVAAPITQKKDLYLSSTYDSYLHDDQERELHEKEAASERMRQLYVALTRAKSRLYIPHIPKENTPINHFLAQVLQGKALQELIEHHEAFDWAPPPTTTLTTSPTPPKLFAPTPFKAHYPSPTIHSFSSLTSHYPPPLHSETHSKLPSGAEVGTIIHTLFEVLPFEKASSSTIAPFLKGTILEPFVDEVASLIYHALHTPLHPTTPFSLSEVDPHKITKEMPFLFDDHTSKYLTGVIDLFFEHENTYYFLDWKSNDLGDDYSQERLEEAMQGHHYDLQAKIYTDAITKYLKLFGKEDQFGGFYYLFLRGLPQQQGVYYVPA